MIYQKVDGYFSEPKRGLKKAKKFFEAAKGAKSPRNESIIKGKLITNSKNFMKNQLLS